MEKEIIIFHTNDMHGRLSTHDDEEVSIGLDKISKVVNKSLLKNKNTFWFDAGDLVHGTPRMTYGSKDSLVETLNSTHLNALVTGNHEFNYSLDYLYKLSRELNAFILSANSIDKNTKCSVLLPYVIYSVDLNQNDYLDISGNSNDSQLDNIKIGLFGLATPESAYKANPNNVRDIEFKNPIEVAKNIVKLLRNSCDIIIALTHLGLDDSSEFTSRKLAEEVGEIDLIIDGHSHTELLEGLKINNSVIVQTGSHGKNLGKVTLSITNRQITDIFVELLNENQVNKIINTPDSYIDDRLRIIDEYTNLTLNNKVAYLPKDLSGDRQLVRRKESELGNLVADAYKWKTNADLAVNNGGDLRTGLPKGDLSYRDLISVFPFGSSVQKARVKGSAIKDMLEHSVFSYPAAFGGFLTVSKGTTFEFNPEKPIGDKVSNVVINGEELDFDKEYTLASTDFLFVGGDDYSMLIDSEMLEDVGKCERVVIDYLNEVGLGDIEVSRMKVIE